MSEASSTPSQITEQEILDYAVRIGVQSKKSGLSKNHLEHLVATLDAIEDERLCLLVTAAFAFRQARRQDRAWRRETGGWDMETASEVGKAMQYLYERNGTRRDARKLLGLAKWVFEGLDRDMVLKKRLEVKNFQDCIKLMVGEGHVG